MRGGVARRGIEHVYGGATVAGLSEGQLLDRFVNRRDPVAFEAIVARHGPMVLGVCRRLLRDPNDVDDAFQATFLVLVRKAAALRRRDLLGNWLYGVAYKVASRARAAATARPRPEGIDVEAIPVPEAPEAVDPALWEEVERLPEKYGTPVVLCYLEGLSHDEAAARLGWPLGTVKGRLARARELLRNRLLRRGVTPTALAAALEAPAVAVVPEQLATLAIKAATAGVVSAETLALTEGVILAMWLSKLKTLAVAFASASALLSVSGALAYQASGKAGPATAATAATAATTPARSVPAVPNPPTPARSTNAPVVAGASDLAATFGAVANVDSPANEDRSPRVRLAEQAARLARSEIPASDRGIHDALDRSVNVEFPNETPLGDVLKSLKMSSRGGPNDSGVPIYVDPVGLQEAEQTITSPVTMDLKDVPFKTALKLLLDQLRMGYEVQGGVLVISSPKRLAAMRKPRSSQAILDALEAPIDLQFAQETPLEEYLEFVRAATAVSGAKAIPIYVDPVGLQEAEQTLSSPVVIALEGVPLRTTLRLVLKQLGLAYCVRDGVLIISSVEGIAEEIDEALALQGETGPSSR